MTNAYRHYPVIVVSQRTFEYARMHYLCIERKKKFIKLSHVMDKLFSRNVNKKMAAAPTCSQVFQWS